MMRLTANEENKLRDSAQAAGMPICGECMTKGGDFDDGGIWVDVDVGLIGRKKWVKHSWTVDLGGRKYAVGQDPEHSVVAYASLDSAGRRLPVWSVASMTIRYALLAIVLTIWTVVGFVFWIPLIVRNTVAFCVTAVYANLVRPNPNVPNRGLQHAALFYLNGFRSIHRGVLEPNSSDPDTIPSFERGRFFAEALWALLFWWASALLLAYFDVAFASYQDQLTDPILWLVERVSAGWTWLNEQVDALILRGRELMPPAP